MALPVVGELQAWKDPSIVALGRLDIGTIRRGIGARAFSLDGEWRFALYPSPDEVPGGAVGAPEPIDGAPWRAVSVPGNWTMQDVGDIPHYTNIQMPFGGPPPKLPSRNPTGVYRRSFVVPSNWADDRAVLIVGGADSVHAVYVNGQFVGYGTDARLASEYDISDVVVDGENSLAIVVFRYSAHSYIEDQDAWWMAGLHRSISVEARAHTRLANVVVEADWDCERSTGALHVVSEVAFDGDIRSGYRTRLRLRDSIGAAVGVAVESDVAHMHYEPYVFTGFTSRGEILAIDVMPWSAESPVLYSCEVELLDSRGTVIDTVVQRIGFRRVEIRGADLLVNGKRIWIHGVNRHDHHPDRGSAVTIGDMREDLVQMRRNNITAIRTSHYPNAPEFYDLCDELGFYVIDEANIESHAYNWLLCDEASYRSAWIERVARMVQRDRNHPSIIMWSLGNEAGYGANHDAAAAWVRREDPTRPLHYEDAIRIQGWADGGRLATDIVCPMYPLIDDLVAYGELVAAGGADRPLIMCEYNHAMGNANGSLSDYWDVIEAYPGLQGGFIWEWKDQTLRMRSGDGELRLAYGGMFGDAPHDFNFVADGLVTADLIPQPAMSELAWVYRPVQTRIEGGSIVIRSCRSFRALDDLVATWTLLCDGDAVASGVLEAPSVEPGAEVRVALPVALPAEGELVFTLTWALREETWYADGGHAVAWDQAIVREEIPRAAFAAADDGAAGDDAAQDRATGGASAVIIDGPELTVWRAPIDNDGFKLFPEIAQRDGKGSMTLFRWEALGLDAKPAEALVDHEHAAAALGDGVLHTHTVTIPDELADLPRVGVRYRIPARFDRVRWYGRGPGENYSDRKRGSMLGVWEAGIDDCPYIVPQEYGLRSDVRWYELIDSAAGERLRIDAFDAPLSVSAIRHTAHELHAASHVDDLADNDDLIVTIDGAHRGVGNHACGPEVLEQYRIGAGTHTFTYSVRW